MSIDIYPDKEFLEETDMVIVDIRTEPEWYQTGIVEGSKCITFFDLNGNYDAEAFLREMDGLGGKEQEIGLICRTGSRTSQVAHFMHQQGYRVKNLAGGVMRLMSQGYRLTDYE
jgi:rhodanese-related sulfurtransferase